jgi:hypothetical protein
MGKVDTTTGSVFPLSRAQFLAFALDSVLTRRTRKRRVGEVEEARKGASWSREEPNTLRGAFPGTV